MTDELAAAHAVAETALRTVVADDPIVGSLARLWADAFPAMGVAGAEALARYEARSRERLRDAGVRAVVAEQRGELAGAMILYDFRMNVRGIDAATGGLGSVAVAFTHKRRGIARTLVHAFLEWYRAAGATFAALHPFRPDFYRALGFGYGTPVQRFRLAPATLRPGETAGTARILSTGDAEALVACDERTRPRVNGLIARSVPGTRRLLGEPALRYVGVESGGALRAFMQTSIQTGPPETANANELVVRDCTYEDEAAFGTLLAYLSAQRDQFARIVVETQDDAFHLSATDPRDGSNVIVMPPATHRVAETGLGVMYRIVDVPRAFTHLGPVETPFALRLEVEDQTFGATAGGWTFRFGRYASPQPDEAARPDAVLRVGIADLSSLVMGSLRLRQLVRHRLAAIEPPVMLDRVDRALRADQHPYCTTRF